jgi:hypothetical protein
MSKLMKQLARAQEEAGRMQESLARRTVEATAGGGAVKVTATGDGNITSIKVDPAALNPADVQLLEDMLLSAVRQAQEKVHALAQSEMGRLTGSMGIPGM